MPSPRLVEGAAGRDPDHPGRDLRALVETIGAPQGGQKDLLNHVLEVGIGGPENARAGSLDHAEVGPKEPADRLFVPPPRTAKELEIITDFRFFRESHPMGRARCHTPGSAPEGLVSNPGGHSEHSAAHGLSLNEVTNQGVQKSSSATTSPNRTNWARLMATSTPPSITHSKRGKNRQASSRVPRMPRFETV